MASPTRKEARSEYFSVDIEDPENDIALPDTPIRRRTPSRSVSPSPFAFEDATAGTRRIRAARGLSLRKFLCTRTRIRGRRLWPQSLLHPLRHPLRILFVFLAIGILGTVLFLWALYEPHVEIRFYSRKWIAQEADASVGPLAGSCFDARNGNISGYNITEGVWNRRSRWDVHAGLDMVKGLACYDFAGIIGRRDDDHGDTPGLDSVSAEGEKTIYHTYWRTDLTPFGSRQADMLDSFFATQPIRTSKLILWSNGDLSRNALVKQYLDRWPTSFETRFADIGRLVRGTALEGSRVLALDGEGRLGAGVKDEKAWIDGDLIRLLVLFKFGGVWVDMDTLLTRNLTPLLEHEFVTQWDCYNKPYTPLNGALMHFHAHSPYLCEAFHTMASSPPPRAGTTDWGSLLYIKLWKRLVHSGIPPFKVLPWCFSDGRSCGLDNRLPDPFEADGEGEGRWRAGPAKGPVRAREMTMEEGGLLDEILHKVFAVHLHNQWVREFPKGGWVQRLLLRRFQTALSDASG